MIESQASRPFFGEAGETFSVPKISPSRSFILSLNDVRWSLKRRGQMVCLHRSPER